MPTQCKPKRQPNLSWFPISFVSSYDSGQLFWTIRHVDQPGVLFLSPEDWDIAYPGLGSPIIYRGGIRVESFIAFPMPKNVHTSLISHPESFRDPSTWAVFVTMPTRWSIVTAMVKKFCCACACCACCSASDPRTHAT